MNRTGILAATVSTAGTLPLLFVVAPQTMRSNMHVVLIMVSFIILLITIGALIGRRIKIRHDVALRQILESFDFQYNTFYNILYGYGKYRDHFICLKYSRVAKTDCAPMLPGTTALVMLCRVKIPRTENKRLHLAVFSENQNQVMRNAFGWINREPGMYLGAIKGQSEAVSASVFDRLSVQTKEKIKKIAETTGSCAISPDWETVMIGRKNALQLVNNDESVLSQLDFQMKIPVGIESQRMASHMDSMIDVAESISLDMR